MYEAGRRCFSKSEMLPVFLGTEDDIIVIDPTLEYFDIAEALGNQAVIVNLSKPEWASQRKSLHFQSVLNQDYPIDFRKCKNDRLFIAYETKQEPPFLGTPVAH